MSPLSSVETSLITDTTTDGHKSFHTTLQITTSQGSKPFQMKVIQVHHAVPFPIPLLHNLPQVFQQDRSPKENSPQAYSMQLDSL